MSHSRHHTHHTDTTRNRIARDESNAKRRREDAQIALFESDLGCDTIPSVEDEEWETVEVDLNSELGQRFLHEWEILTRTDRT